MDGIVIAVVGLVIMAIIIVRLRSRAFQQGFLHGRLQGMCEAVDIFMGYCDMHRVDGEPNPDGIVKAMAELDRASKLDHGKHGINGQITWYQIGINKLGLAVSLATYSKGYDAGWEARNSGR